MRECIENIEAKNVIPYKTSNLLKDLEYEEEVLFTEICENLNK